MNQRQKKIYEDDDLTQTSKDQILVGLKILVEFMRVLLWPAVTLLIFLSVRSPLNSILVELPNVLSQTKSISIGGVSFEKRLEEANIPFEIRTSLKDLSTNAVKKLVSIGNIGFVYLDEKWEQDTDDSTVIKELINNKLVIVSKSRSDEAYPLRLSLTDLGTKAYDSILGLIIDQFKED